MIKFFLQQTLSVTKTATLHEVLQLS